MTSDASSVTHESQITGHALRNRHSGRNTMKRRLGIIALVLALIAGAAGIGWLYFRLNPAAWNGFVAEMQGETLSPSSPGRTPSMCWAIAT